MTENIAEKDPSLMEILSTKLRTMGGDPDGDIVRYGTRIYFVDIFHNVLIDRTDQVDCLIV